MKKKKMHVQDLRHVIEEAIRRLPHGATRLAVSDFPLNYTCLSDLGGPDFGERFTSDSGISSGNEEAEKQYFEEIATIEEIMVEMEIPIELSDWQKRSKSEAVMKVRKTMNRRAYAIQVWAWYAIPWRLDGQSVHIIYFPHDVMGRPVIHTDSAEYFLRNRAEDIAKHHATAESLKKKLSFWKNFGLIVLVVAGIVLGALIQELIAK